MVLHDIGWYCIKPLNHYFTPVIVLIIWKYPDNFKMSGNIEVIWKYLILFFENIFTSLLGYFWNNIVVVLADYKLDFNL